MLAPSERNYMLDAVLLILGAVCIFSGFVLALGITDILNFPWRSLHVLSGFALTAGVAVHLLLHAKWIKVMTSKIVADRRKTLALAMTVLAVLGACYWMIAAGQKEPSRADRRPRFDSTSSATPRKSLDGTGQSNGRTGFDGE